ncbi:MAG: DEAD/DEAH box helicase [Bulleidia sp.]
MNQNIQEIFHKTGYTEMTEVQKQAIPAVMEGKNLFIQAKTGSGKTYAYLIPAMAQVNPHSSDTQVLIIAPTRELAVQIGESAEHICPYFNIHAVVCIGGLDIDRQINALRHRPHIIIGTPGRLNDLLEQNRIQLNSICTLIMDEADQILSTGQKEEVLRLLKQVNTNAQVIAMSATDNPDLNLFLPDNTEKLILDENMVNDRIEIRYVLTDTKENTLLYLLQHLPITTAIVFTNFKNDANHLSDLLNEHGILSSAFSSYFEEKKRLSILKQFKEGKIRILCATDAAARGLDISEVSHIIHYDLPEDVQTFIHRSGRSAHQGDTGMTILMGKDEKQIRTYADTCTPLSVDETYISDLSIPYEKQEIRNNTLKIRIHAGRKDKIRPKDVIGALCTIMDFSDIGTLEIQDTFSSVILLNRDIILPQRITIKGKSRKLSIWD